MAEVVMNLVVFPDTKLRQRSEAVRSMDDPTRSTLRDMHSFMLKNNGVGLAAPQIGILARMFVTDVDGHSPMYFINPIVRNLNGRLSSSKEGCLSIPGAVGEVLRPSSILIRFIDLTGEPNELVCSGVLATVIQHEVDHLDGVLHIDRMQSYVKRMALDGAWSNRSGH